MVSVTTPDGRNLEVLLAGPEDGFPLVFHHGTPQGAVPYPTLETTSDRAGTAGHLLLATRLRRVDAEA